MFYNYCNWWNISHWCVTDYSTPVAMQGKSSSRSLSLSASISHWYIITSVGLVVPYDAIWRHRTVSELAQLMACCLTDCTKSLSEPMLYYHTCPITEEMLKILTWTRPTFERRKTLGHLRSINRNMITHFANQSQTCELLKYLTRSLYVASFLAIFFLKIPVRCILAIFILFCYILVYYPCTLDFY